MKPVIPYYCYTRPMHEFVLFYAKNYYSTETYHLPDEDKKFSFTDEISGFNIHPLYNSNEAFHKLNRPNLYYPFYINPLQKLDNGFYYISLNKEKDYFVEIYPPKSLKNNVDFVWRWGKDKSKENINSEIVGYKTNDNEFRIVQKMRTSEKVIRSILDSKLITSRRGTEELEDLLNGKIFSFPKPIDLICNFLKISTKSNDIILDFFAGSGTTGHAVMELNKDGGNRKFILCQIDEPISKDKPAYKFCIENNLPPVISSITIERLKRAGEKIAKDIQAEDSKPDLFGEDKKQVPDIGFKVFDSVEAPALEVDEKGQISISFNDSDALSRIYNMIFTVGLDEPTQVPEEVVKDCIYKIGSHYYITNSDKITSDDYSNAIKNGKVFIDGWTASLNGTLQNYKEDVKIVF